MALLERSRRAGSARLFAVPFLIALAFCAVAVIVAVVAGLPLRETVGSARKIYAMVPLLMVGAIVVDVVVRVTTQRPKLHDVGRAAFNVLRTRWTGMRLAGVAAGVMSAYLVYLAYRNLKVFLPYVRTELADRTLTAADEWLSAGHSPSGILQQLLGTGVASEVLSTTYMAFMLFVPLSLAAALIWSKQIAHGMWYACAICFNWVIGIASYYAVPSVGPIYSEPFRFSDLPITSVSKLQDSLYQDRLEIIANPHTTDAIHGIAAFASLHVSIVFTAALIARRTGVPKLLQRVLWVYLGLTFLSTIYFGWHYLLDDAAGFGVGALSVWLAGLAVGCSTRASTSSQRVGATPGESFLAMGPSWRSHRKLG